MLGVGAAAGAAGSGAVAAAVDRFEAGPLAAHDGSDNFGSSAGAAEDRLRACHRAWSLLSCPTCPALVCLSSPLGSS